MKRYILILGFFVGIFILGCKTPEMTNNTPPKDDSESPLAYSGGEATIFGVNTNMFFQPSPLLYGQRLIFHLQGDEAFETKFVAYPSPINQGLGPIYINVSCRSCHGRDGRGRPAENNQQGTTDMIFRISIPGTNVHGGPNPVPGFGDKLQNSAIEGVTPEGKMGIMYEELPGEFPDGEKYSLRKPTYTILTPYIPLPADVMISARIPRPVFGLGMLEAVDEKTILEYADEDDTNHDGISGRPNYVYNVQTQTMSLGRFGWKAGTPSILQQAAEAYNGDMGITSPLMPVQVCHDQPQCVGASVNQEVSSLTLLANAHYVRTLAIPARRKIFDPQTQRGEKIFVQAKCSRCHRQEMKTGKFEDVEETANQTIRPYTDLLLHDMGPGLADNRPDYRATGREFRTPPLWGIGLTQIVSGFSFFLNDGRARSIMEAILWHGGEAQQASDFFIGLSKADREALLAFLYSL